MNRVTGTSSRRSRRLAALTLAITTFAALAFASQAGATITPTSNAATIYPAINATGGPITGASFLNQPGPGSGFGELPNAVSNTALTGFPLAGSTDYGILTSGDPLLAEDPNNSSGSGLSYSGDPNAGNYRGTTDYDVTVLSFNLTVPAVANPCLNFQFRFLSEEYPEYVGTSYNDAFIAELDTSDWSTTSSDITGVQNFALDQSGNPITINATGPSTVNPVNSYGTTYDSATRLLKAAKATTAGPHTLYLSIFDQGDHILDATAFVDNVAVTSDATCSTGQVSPADNPPDNSPSIGSATIGPDSAEFGFVPNGRAARAPGDTYICQLHEGPASDLAGEPYEACTSPKAYNGLFDGDWTFRVATVNAAGVPDQTPTVYPFCIGTCSTGGGGGAVTPPAPAPAPLTPAPAKKKCKKAKKGATAAKKCKKKK
jgi:hypothetical protein